MPYATGKLSVEAACQICKQAHDFVYLRVGGGVDPRICNAWCSFWKYNLDLHDRPSTLLELKIRMLKAKVVKITMYGYITWSSPRYAATNPLQLINPLCRMKKA